MLKLSKKRREVVSHIDKSKLYNSADAITILKKFSSSNFVESLDVAINLGVDPRHADQAVKGVCQLPNGLGKSVKIAVFAKGDLAEKALIAGADIVGSDDLVKDIMAGNFNFDRCIATPDMMPLVGRLGKVLGPRGLMPNPKTGTVTNDVEKVVNEIKSGAIEFKCDKTGIVHVSIGKISFDIDQLVGNLEALIKALLKAKPSGAKGNYIIKSFLSTTQGVGLPIDVKEFLI